jgi:hypothetical protein
MPQTEQHPGGHRGAAVTGIFVDHQDDSPLMARPTFDCHAPILYRGRGRA